ncbi:MAG: ABC transporter ATP-binding protein [Verrucomicrobiota bacterium]|nr:ABC transporter ATP-binding protein [Verrucomicrobiota bacterium]
MITNFIRLFIRCYRLARPYGKQKLFVVLAVIFTNGLFQVIGVTSIFPFFALAAEPERIRNSRFGSMLLSHLPPMDQTTLLIWAGSSSIALLFLSNAITLSSEVIRTRYGHGLGHFLRVRLMTALAARPYGYFLERNSGVLLQKVIGDVMQFINGVFLAMMEAISRIITLSFLLFTVFLVQPFVALGAALLLGGFYGTVFLVLRHRSRKLGDGINEANRGTLIAAQHFFGGIKPILVHGKTPYFTEEFARHSKAQAKLYPWLPIFGNGPRYLIEPVALGGLVLAVIWLAFLGRNFSDILPNLTVMALAGYRMIPSVQLLYSQLNQITIMAYTVGEIESEMTGLSEVILPGATQSSAVGSEPLTFEKSIRLENITFNYPHSSRPVLANFSLEIPRNSSIGIVGVTGSGKSTLVDIILGLHRPQSGCIRVDEQVLVPANYASWRALIGYVPQDIYLLDDSIAANIAFGVPHEMIDREAMYEAASAAQILGFIESGLPTKWDTIVGERGVRLSGGQRQRIGLARALYHRPQLLILDEATSALDTDTETEVIKAIESLRGKVTMIVVAHRLSTIQGCNTVCRLG